MLASAWQTALLLHGAAALPAEQQPLIGIDIATDIATTRRPLHGKFLHITDFHPDSFYEVYSSTAKDAACHRGQGPAGIYGAETSECDSPISLVNKTMEWVRDHLRDEVDFVLWTGDSARHDSDEEHPRTQKEVLQLNQFMIDKMFDAFGKKDHDNDDDPNSDFVVPIVPTFGNNDIMPHNIMTKGPNSWTRAYTTLWRHFIPEAQKHQFEQGGWFFVEVIPNKLAVFSLNTMYFFTNNAAVDGCAAHSEPGYRQMEWLRIQLQFIRDRGMKAILIGHVPPVRQDAKSLFDETCWQKYTLWLRQYRDVVVSSMYGHFNYDHFLLQDFDDIEKDTEDGAMRSLDTRMHHDDVEVAVSSSYFLQLRDEWSDLPNPPKSMTSKDSWLSNLLSIFKKKDDKTKRKEKKYLKKIGGKYAERFAASFVSASVVPNLYPTLRVYEYNISGMNRQASTSFPVSFENEIMIDDISTAKKHKKYKFKIPDGPSQSAPPGPAYSPQTFSLLKYKSYFANLTHINNDFTESDIDTSKWKEGKHKGKKPHDKDHTPNPKKFKYEVQYDTQEDEIYHLKDLTMPSLVELARRIGRFVPDESLELDGSLSTAKKGKKHRKHGKKGSKKHEENNKPWYTFISRAFVYTMNDEEIRDEFGH